MKGVIKEKKTDCADCSLSQFDRTIEKRKGKLKEKPDKIECLKAKEKHRLDYELSHFDGEHVKSIEERKRKLKEKKQPVAKRLKRKRLEKKKGLKRGMFNKELFLFNHRQ